MFHSSSLPFTVGKFLVTPLSRLDAAGLFVPLLSIRSGQGTQTRDKVYTFQPTFDNAHGALAYAAEQSHQLIAPVALA